MFGRAPQPRIYIQEVYSIVNAVYTVVVLNVRIEVALDEVYQTVSLALSQFMVTPFTSFTRYYRPHKRGCPSCFKTPYATQNSVLSFSTK